MKNFVFSNPTRIIFGKGSIEEIPKYVPPRARILMTYGRGSIKLNGVYDKVHKVLENVVVFEFGGIESNPRYETCMKGLDIVRKEGVDFLLAVGGGSVLDGTKFIALAQCYTASKEPWDFMAGLKPGPNSAMPIGSVMTLPASGSEMNSNLVISRESSQDKCGYSSYQVYPKFSILDPEVTYSLPRHQMANGIVDTFVHVMEQYVTYPTYAPLQDRQAEALIATILEEAPKVLLDPKNYNVRATLMWCATQAINGTINRGVPQDWSTHSIGHEITALYGLDHAATIAIVLCGIWENQFENKKAKLSHYGRRIWNLQGDNDTVARGALAKTEAFFESMGVPTRFASYGLNGVDVANTIVKRFGERSFKGIGEHQSVGIEQIRAILVARA